MQSISSATTPWQTISYYPIPKHFYTHHHHLSLNKNSSSSYNFSTKTHLINKSSITLNATTNSFSKEQSQRKNPNNNNNKQYPFEKHPIFFQDFYSDDNIDENIPKPQNKKEDLETPDVVDLDNTSSEIPMRWAGFKAVIGQRINLEGIACSIGVFAKDKHLVVPHVSVPDIRYIDWAELKKRGFKGVVFDKDNTLTLPYSLNFWPPLGSTLEECKSHFGNNIAVFSNSAGLYEYDPDGKKARALENAIGIRVIRHGVKKPAGTVDEIEKHFNCESSRLIMVGDRPFTDVVYGNRNGFLTILTEPLSLSEEPLIVKQVRKLEVAFLNKCMREDVKPSGHDLLPTAAQCLKDQPL